VTVDNGENNGDETESNGEEAGNNGEMEDQVMHTVWWETQGTGFTSAMFLGTPETSSEAMNGKISSRPFDLHNV
jgi:hypothetical protein